MIVNERTGANIMIEIVRNLESRYYQQLLIPMLHNVIETLVKLLAIGTLDIESTHQDKQPVEDQ